MHRRRFPHIAFIYLILVLAVILASWTGSVLEMRFSSVFSMYGIRSMLSAAGIRWLVSNAGNTIARAPIGNAIMLFMAFGAVNGSGLGRAIVKCFRGALSPREKASLTVAAVSLLLLGLLFVMGAVSGGNLSVGLAGGLSGSPLAMGLAFTVMLAATVPSIAYGLASGTFQSSHDCVRALAGVVAQMAEFLVCMVVASQLVETILYTRLDVLLGIGPQLMRTISFVLYWLPLPLVILYRHR